VIGGTFWGIHHLRKNYSSSKPLALTQLQTESEVAPPPPASTSPDVDNVAPQPRPTPLAAPSTAIETGDVEARWKTFEKAAKHGGRAHIELTADEINTLLANDKNTRGKAFVRIENNVGHVTVSIPLGDLPLMKGRYLNGQATLQASPDGDPAKVQISNVMIGSETVPDDFLDRRIFGWHTLRGYITEWLDDQNVTGLRVENNRVIGDAGSHQ
ncbi:MAG TPA: hypothetical protein VGC85_03090, partial [Chthoniobacterales bacterium]